MDKKENTIKYDSIKLVDKDGKESYMLVYPKLKGKEDKK